jgi:hypothetical protein
MALNGEFTITDVDGNVHAYTVHPHPTGEGLALLSELMAIASKGLHGAVGSMSFSKMSKAAAKGDVSALEAVDIDEGMLGAAVASVITELHTSDAEAIAKRLLAYTYRDSRPMAGTAGANGLPASEDGPFSFDRAFARNYGELRSILVSIARYNFASFFVGLGKGGAMLKLMQARQASKDPGQQ